MAASIPSITLYDGLQMPLVGLGTWLQTTEFTPEQNESFINSIKHALDLGYRHFDTAALYNTEKPLGLAIAAKVTEGTVRREELFITTKPGSFESDDSLQVDESVPLIDTWKAMEECKRQGLARTIGVSNFNSQQLTRIMEQAEVKPSNNQIEVHLYLQCKKMVTFCKDHGIAVVCYSPLALQKKDEGFDMGNDPVLCAMSQKYGCTNQQVALRFLVQKQMAVIPKSTNPQRQQENFNIFSFEISDDDMKKLEKLDKKARLTPINGCRHAKEYPFHEEF